MKLSALCAVLFPLGPPRRLRRHPQIPLLRRGGSREATGGVVCHLPAHVQKNHPGDFVATPPKEGNFRLKRRREAPTISFPSL